MPSPENDENRPLLTSPFLHWTDKEDLVNATALVVWFDLAPARGTNRAGVESAAQTN